MKRLLHGLVDHVRLEPEQGPEAGRSRRPEMGDVIDLVFVQADRADEIDLDLVAGRERADERPPVAPALLRDGEDRRDIVAGMAVLGRQKRIVVIEFTHGRSVRPGRPFRMHADARIAADYIGAAGARMGQSLRPRRGNRPAVDGCDRDGGVVDDPVDDHRRHCRFDLHRILRHAGDLPGKLLVFGQPVPLGMDADVVVNHGAGSGYLAKIANAFVPRNPLSCIRMRRNGPHTAKLC